MTDFNDPKMPRGVGRVNRRQAGDLSESKSWWTTSRRKFLIGGIAAIGVVGAVGFGTWWWMSDDDDTEDVTKDSLELQQKEGWNVGSEDKKLTLPNAQTVDSQTTEGWKKYLDPAAMLTAFQTRGPVWGPYFVPTLIQSLQFDSLRTQLAPIFTPDMDESYQRGQGIAKDFLVNAKNAGETALIVDLPGRDSVAFGAGMAEYARLITIFDNFPHPLGVTPSQETLGAMLYYATEIEAKQTKLADNTPPAFLLDSNRLAEYKDEDAQFDNRYLAKLPSAQKFQENGIKSLLYITPDRNRKEELDDLNDDFVEYKGKGINVGMLPLSDFTPTEAIVENKLPDGTTRTVVERHYYYGGSPASHYMFFHSYPYYTPIPLFIQRYPSYSTYRPSPATPPPIAPPTYAPVSRPTLFSGTRIGGNTAGVGRSKPSGFGRSTVRVSTAGSVVGTKAGKSGYYSGSRSGSFGRGGGYSG